jgi:hypothetical protein
VASTIVCDLTHLLLHLKPSSANAKNTETQRKIKDTQRERERERERERGENEDLRAQIACGDEDERRDFFGSIST